ncbi:MAG: ABC transporter permease, partial [Planctomycetota bacterium]
IFSLINGILLRSLPVRDPHQLRVINWTGTKVSLGTFRERDDATAQAGQSRVYCSGAFPYPAYRYFVDNAIGFSDVFAFSFLDRFESGATISAGGVASVVDGLMVSGNFFKGYGARVLIGRPITPQDDRPDVEPVAVITYRLWQDCYGLDPNVVGRILMVDNIPSTIVGVLPRNHMGPMAGDPTEFYVPMAAQPQLRPELSLTSYDHWWVQIGARLAPGANEAQARSSVEVLFNQALSASASRVEIEQPKILLRDGRRGLLYLVYQEISGPLWILQGVVGVILLIACANLASLLLARGAARRHEMAVRAAMGAGRWRLMRQLLTESLVISLFGACLGLVLSLWLKAVVVGFLAGSVETLDSQHFNLHIDMSVLLFTLAISIITTVLCGLFPALRAGYTDPSAGLKDGGLRGAPRLRLGKILLTAQVGLSVLLVMGAGLLTRSLVNLYRIDLGLEAQNLLVFRLNPLESEYKRDEDLVRLYDTVRERIAGIPGVRSVSLARCGLLDGGMWIEGIAFPDRPGEKGLSARSLTVSDGWFTTMGIRLLSGRDFGVTDTEDSQRVVIVNEAFAEEFFPDENPVGKIFTWEEFLEYQIVGLCRDHISFDLRDGPSRTMYFCHRQRIRREMTFTIRSAIPPLSLVSAVRKAVDGVDRNLPLDDVTTQVLLLDKFLSGERLFTFLCGGLALLALALSCIGLYGLMAYNVARRTGEMGIRMALGAQPRAIAWTILYEALKLAVIGVAIGLPVALALVQVIQGIIYDIHLNDPLTIIGTVVIMVAVAALAAWIPARRAARIDPMNALRYE